MPSFIVTLGGLLVLEGVSIIVLGGSLVGIGNSHYNNEVVLYDLFYGTFDPAVSWILLAVVAVVAGTFVWLGDARRRRSGLVAPPATLTALKILVALCAGVLVVALSNVNRAHFGVIHGLPFIIPIVMVVLVAWTFLLQRTKFGRYVYAIGGNPEAARRAGISLPVIRTWGFVLASLTAGIAGILFASWQVSLTTNVIKDANSYVLLAVAAAVIGGTSLFGGRGKTHPWRAGRSDDRRHLQRPLSARHHVRLDRHRRCPRPPRGRNHRRPLPPRRAGAGLTGEWSGRGTWRLLTPDPSREAITSFAGVLSAAGHMRAPWHRRNPFAVTT